MKVKFRNNFTVTKTGVDVQVEQEAFVPNDKSDTAVAQKFQALAEGFNGSLVDSVVRKVAKDKNAPSEFFFSFEFHKGVPVVTDFNASYDGIEYKDLLIHMLQSRAQKAVDSECSCPVCARDGSFVAVIGHLTRLAVQKLGKIVADNRVHLKQVAASVLSNAHSFEKASSFVMDEPDLIEGLKRTYIPSDSDNKNLASLAGDLTLNVSSLLRFSLDSEEKLNRMAVKIVYGYIVLHSLFEADENAFWSVVYEVEEAYSDSSTLIRSNVKDYLSFVLRGLSMHSSKLRNPFGEALADAEIDFAGLRATNFFYHPRFSLDAIKDKQK